MLNTPFSPWPSYTEEEIVAVSKILQSGKVNYWTGTECREFEKEFTTWCGTKYAVALTNGTFALEAALKALNIGTGDEVIVTPRTFFASVSCIVNVGARPIFADVDADSQNITAETISAVLTPKTKAIICVHLAGWPCDMDPIMDLAKKLKLKVIEDCAQAHGAQYKGRMVGSIGDIGAWSFCQDKIMTTAGEGGMVTTNDKNLWSTMWSYKDHGKSWDAMYDREHHSGFRWLHESFGTNGRMLEIQAAIGRIQLKRMEQWTKARTDNTQKIADICRQHQLVRTPKTPADIRHANYKFYTFVNLTNLADGWSRNRIIDAIIEKGVPCYQGSCSEVYLEKAFDKIDFRPSQNLPIAKKLGETSLMFLVHPTLTKTEIDKTCSVIDTVFKQATKSI